eukprot:9074040-Alexandrium_andersonii.AAC.1
MGDTLNDSPSSPGLRFSETAVCASRRAQGRRSRRARRGTPAAPREVGTIGAPVTPPMAEAALTTTETFAAARPEP